MATMYETIMDLPLFKGVSKAHVSLFLEKTNIDFCNYEAGEVLIEAGDPVTMVKFVITGGVRVMRTFHSLPIKVEETCGPGTVLGADRLFGISTGYAYDVRSIGKTSIMQFSKEQYVNLLHSDRIYMFNFFNYLSLRAQRQVETISDYAGSDLHSRLSIIVSGMTLPTSSDISIIISDDTLRIFGKMSAEEVEAWKETAIKKRLISCSHDRINILSRRDFLNRQYVF
ncbi:MAG: cyclic nucleotide-binding domain-containing protein [Bacteroides sp.]|nr:cyclic nucleotide-binding domain-containing protein [Bacteroides sp.]